MAGNGVFLALGNTDLQQLLLVRNNTELLAYLRKQRAGHEVAWLLATDAAWEVLHRCLGDGSLRWTGKSVLEKCVIGGRAALSGRRADRLLPFPGRRARRGPRAGAAHARLAPYALSRAEEAFPLVCLQRLQWPG